MSGIHLALLGMSFGAAGPTVIGQPFGGGFYAGDISVAGNGVASHYLIVAPKSSGENSSKQWKTSNTTTSGTTSVIDGPANTAAMIAAGAASHPAADFCNGLSIGGFSDWYMPAKNELEVCYYNLKPSTANNKTTGGTNTNAVPSRNSNYTTTVPGQTSAVDFQMGNSEAFDTSAASLYWSSTENAASTALYQYWPNTSDSGEQGADSKTSSSYVRAVRRVAV